MTVLLDQSTPAPLRRHLGQHEVDAAFEQGWFRVRNGELLDRAEANGYHLLGNTDQNLRHQQNFVGRQLAIIVLLAALWPRIRLHIDDLRAAVDRVEPGTYAEIPI